MNKGKFSARKLCTLAVLTAITVVLSAYATFRIGNQIKIPLKFITIFITGVVFGPLEAGILAAAADFINAQLFPVGAWIPQITAAEFLSGIIFGLCFIRAKDNKLYYIRMFVCAAAQLLEGAFVNSYILFSVGIFPDFKSALIIRMPALAVVFVLQIAAMFLLKKFVFVLKEGKIYDRKL